jgi:hypothetical protein
MYPILYKEFQRERLRACFSVRWVGEKTASESELRGDGGSRIPMRSAQDGLGSWHLSEPNLSRGPRPIVPLSEAGPARNP